MSRLFFYIFILSFFLSFSQKEKQNSLITVRGNIGIPRTVSSHMFRTAFNGVYEGNLSVNARIFSNFFVGLGYQNSHFQNNKQVFAYKQFLDPNGKATGVVLSYNTRITGHSGFLKLGYDKFFEKGYVCYSVNTGIMACEYTNVNPDTALANRPYPTLKFTAPYIQPEIGINFMADGVLGFSIILSYTTLFYHFDPKAPRFNHFKEVNEKKNKHSMSWINIGFGFTVMIGKK